MDGVTEMLSDCISVVSDTTQGTDDCQSPSYVSGLKMLQVSREQDAYEYALSPVIEFGGRIAVDNKTRDLPIAESYPEKLLLEDDSMSVMSESLLTHKRSKGNNCAANHTKGDNSVTTYTKGNNLLTTPGCSQDDGVSQSILVPQTLQTALLAQKKNLPLGQSHSSKSGKSREYFKELLERCKRNLDSICTQITSGDLALSERTEKQVVVKMKDIQGTILQALQLPQCSPDSVCQDCVVTSKSILRQIHQGHDTQRIELATAVKQKGLSKERKQQLREQLMSLSERQKLLLDLMQNQQELNKVFKTLTLKKGQDQNSMSRSPSGSKLSEDSDVTIPAVDISQNDVGKKKHSCVNQTFENTRQSKREEIAGINLHTSEKGKHGHEVMIKERMGINLNSQKENSVSCTGSVTTFVNCKRVAEYTESISGKEDMETDFETQESFSETSAKHDSVDNNVCMSTEGVGEERKNCLENKKYGSDSSVMRRPQPGYIMLDVKSQSSPSWKRKVTFPDRLGDDVSSAKKSLVTCNPGNIITMVSKTVASTSLTCATTQCRAPTTNPVVSDVISSAVSTILGHKAARSLQKVPKGGISATSAQQGPKFLSNAVGVSSNQYTSMSSTSLSNTSIQPKSIPVRSNVTSHDSVILPQEPGMKNQHVKKQDWISLAEMVQTGVLEPGPGVLTVMVKDKLYRASLATDGSVESTDGCFKTPTGWVSKVTNVSVKRLSAYKRVLYKGIPLASFQEKVSHKQRTGSCIDTGEKGPPPHSLRKKASPEIDLSKLLSDCTVRLVKETELVHSDTFLPKLFWEGDFAGCRLSRELWNSIEEWWSGYSHDLWNSIEEW